MRHTTNKRGFTLTEIMIVIAIIVILVSAVSAGIAIDLNRYKNHLASLTTDEGESAWEIAARSEVAGIFGAAASDNAIALASQSAAAESSIAAAGLASQSAAAVKASEAAVSASAAAISDAAASASAAAATTAGASSAAASVAAATTQSSSGGGSTPAGWNVSGGLVATNTKGITSITQTGNSTVVTIDSGNNGGTVSVTFNKNSDNTYTISNMSGRTDLVQNLTSQYHGGLINSNSGYALTTGQYNWLRDNYGLSLPSGYVAADNNRLSGGVVSSANQVYYRNDTGVVSLSSSGSNSSTITVNSNGSQGTFSLTKNPNGTYTLSNVSNNGNVVGNYINDYWKFEQGQVTSYSASELSRLCNAYGITLN